MWNQTSQYRTEYVTQLQLFLQDPTDQQAAGVRRFAAIQLLKHSPSAKTDILAMLVNQTDLDPLDRKKIKITLSQHLTPHDWFPYLAKPTDYHAIQSVLPADWVIQMLDAMPPDRWQLWPILDQLPPATKLSDDTVNALITQISQLSGATGMAWLCDAIGVKNSRVPLALLKMGTISNIFELIVLYAHHTLIERLLPPEPEICCQISKQFRDRRVTLSNLIAEFTPTLNSSDRGQFNRLHALFHLAEEVVHNCFCKIGF